MKSEQGNPKPDDVKADVNRLLEIGALLVSVLTPEEIDWLRFAIRDRSQERAFSDFLQLDPKIGNMSVT